ncbi:glycosyl hydrolase family 18 protein [Streptomyces sp. 769]|uniref:glycosyl hydrolase family 18 protein n=1 Tax=Streptomyces sp. 769 TaxID=1262452 RepID=UPI001EEF8481|nr:glycosyl hydrolase family 18 protein [Streptomyces sp. 769]
MSLWRRGARWRGATWAVIGALLVSLAVSSGPGIAQAATPTQPRTQQDDGHETADRYLEIVGNLRNTMTRNGNGQAQPVADTPGVGRVMQQPNWQIIGIGALGGLDQNAVQLVIDPNDLYVRGIYVRARNVLYAYTHDGHTTGEVYIPQDVQNSIDPDLRRVPLSFSERYRDVFGIELGATPLRNAVRYIAEFNGRTLDDLQESFEHVIMPIAEGARFGIFAGRIAQAMRGGQQTFHLDATRAGDTWVEYLIHNWTALSDRIRQAAQNDPRAEGTEFTQRRTFENTQHGHTFRYFLSYLDIARRIATLKPPPRRKGRVGIAPVPRDGEPRIGPPPGASNDNEKCRPDGMPRTPGVDTPYCLAYTGEGREWMGKTHDRRVIGYFAGWRTGKDGSPAYRPQNVPWGQITHLNYAFAHVTNNKLAVGDQDVENIRLLNEQKAEHPRVKTLISVGGWSQTRGLYTLVTGSDAQSKIDTFADSAAEFIRQNHFNGVDIDFEYPTSLENTGNPEDWPVSNPVRGELMAGYGKLMKTLREKLDRASAADGTYYLLSSAVSSSGYLVRGMENHDPAKYQDYVDVMAYDFHGTWNGYVGPNAPLYDDGKDTELADAGVYSTKEYGGIGYFNTDWAFKHFRGALQAGRINIGIPYYTRGWSDVSGGNQGMWGTSKMPDQSQCPAGTGSGPGAPPGTRPCGEGARGIDNIWHDTTNAGGELPAGTNPMWHAKNLEANIEPNYGSQVGLDPERNASDRLTGNYARHWDDTTKTSWLWNEQKKTFLSTTDTQAVDAVADYVTRSGAGGVMIWELAGDYSCPATPTAENPCGMGYTMTSRLDEKLGHAGDYGNSRAAGSTAQLPARTANLEVDLVDYPAGSAKLYPLEPKVRLTNNTGKAIGGGAELSFDIPTSTSPLVKDGNWQGSDTPDGLWRLTPGHTGPNAGTGLKGDFHRVTTKIEYCQVIPAGKSINIPIKYYLPITGPANATLTTSGGTYGLASDNRRGAEDAGEVADTGCNAPDWDAAKAYDPATQSHEDVTVKYNGHYWRAKWWTQNNAPGTGPDADHEPWKDLGPTS